MAIASSDAPFVVAHKKVSSIIWVPRESSETLAMAISWRSRSLVVVVVLLLASIAIASPDAPFVVAHKKVSSIIWVRRESSETLAMAISSRSRSLLLLLILLVVASMAIVSSDAPFVVAHKKVSSIIWVPRENSETPAMAISWRSRSLLLLLLVVASMAIVSSDAPFVVAHKKVSSIIWVRRERSETLAMAISSRSITLLLLLLLASMAIANSDAPFVMEHKKVSLSRLKSGAERVSVSIDLYNQGSTIATSS